MNWILNFLALGVLFLVVIHSGTYIPAYLFILGYLMAQHHKQKGSE